MNDPATLFSQLELLTGKFPESTLKAAVEQREVITPLLLGELRKFADDPAAVEQLPADYMRLTYAIYLLAQFREQQALAPLLAFLSTPGELVMDLLEGVITEDLGRILASICAGDITPIKTLIENPEANEWVRCGALDTLAVLYRKGQLSRDDYIAYLHELFSRRIERNYCVFWGSLVADACELGAVELLPEIQRAFDDELVDHSYIGPSYAEELIQGNSGNPPDNGRGRSREFIGPVVDEIRWWACFNQKKPSDNSSSRPAPKTAPAQAFNATTKTVRSGPKIGRNDPCPCGSGKKYKKCCLG